MVNPIRIRTRFDFVTLSTMYYNGKWFTFCREYGISFEAYDILDAGRNHLLGIQKIAETSDWKGSVDTKSSL